MKLSEEERLVMNTLRLRPHGTLIRCAAGKRAVLALAGYGYVCDPHEMQNSLFTRITPAGRAALQGDEP